VWLAAKEILGYLDQSQVLPIPRDQVQIAIEHQGAARHVFEDGTGHGFAVADARDEELRGLRHFGDLVLSRRGDRGRPALDLRLHVLLQTFQRLDHSPSHVQEDHGDSAQAQQRCGDAQQDRIGDCLIDRRGPAGNVPLGCCRDGGD
jgi:hypothetical protein